MQMALRKLVRDKINETQAHDVKKQMPDKSYKKKKTQFAEELQQNLSLESSIASVSLNDEWIKIWEKKKTGFLMAK